MRKRLSLQWQLTIMTALLVITACLIVSFSISSSAVLYMDEIEDSVIAVFPKETLSPADGTPSESGPADIRLDISGNISDQVQNTQTEFWKKSLLFTALVALAGSATTYFIVGFSLRPLKKLGKQVEDIQEKNLQQPIDIESGSAEIAQLSEAFNGMLKRLGDAFFVQRQFSANTAHELRTPLAVMQTRLDVLKKQTAPSREECLEVLDMMHQQTDRLARVIDALLEMTELKTASRSDRIDLSALVEEILCDLAPLSEEKAVALIHEPDDAVITGNDTLIYRAVYNLVENAVKYNRPGGSVSIGIKKETALVRVVVSDTGTGIAGSDQDRIFEPFYRVDKSRSRAMGGAGLGLALVREIADMHGGSVRVAESSPEGTQIELTLPSL